MDGKLKRVGRRRRRRKQLLSDFQGKEVIGT
jgi:hypothetical protein